MIVIIGSGPSGLIAGNYLKSIGKEFKIISSGNGGFHPISVNGMNFTLGQRTMFYSDLFYDFLGTSRADKVETQELTDLISVNYKGILHSYPIQNNLKGFSLGDRMKIWLSYLFRDKKLAENGNYSDWVTGNYGKWLADNVILPHTDKTMKEDLYTIRSDNYGKKVVGMSLWGKANAVREITNPQEVFEHLKDRIKDDIVDGTVSEVDEINGFVRYDPPKSDNYAGFVDVKFDRLINTVALPKFLNLLSGKPAVVDIARLSLRWNNMFIGVMVVPTSFVRTDKKIVYFPERNYIFSKVYFQCMNGYTIITCEHSFRRNDSDLYFSSLYQGKILERMEDDLKKSRLVTGATFLSYEKFSHSISPAYIVCDEEYAANNSFLQGYLEHYNIFSVGRFSEWKPNLRVEHSVERMSELHQKWGPTDNLYNKYPMAGAVEEPMLKLQDEKGREIDDESL